MKWTSLRRWTMRTIHATILGSALVGTASIVSAQGPTTAASKVPGVTYINRQTFDLPVDMEPGYRATLSKIRLYVKTPTSAWEPLDDGSGQLTRFNIRVPRDGEYWYSLVTVDQKGQADPPDVTVRPPAQRVVIDTTAPVIHVQAANAPDGDLCLRCTIQDANPDHASLMAFCKTDKGNIPLESVPNQPGMFRVKNAELMRFPVVISAMDLAKNVGTKEINVRDIIGTTLGKGPAEVTQTSVRPEVPKEGSFLPPPRFNDPPNVLPQYGDKQSGEGQNIAFPPLGSTSNKIGDPADMGNKQAGLEIPAKSSLPPATILNQGGVPHRLINTTHATVEYNIDQIGPSGVGKVEIYQTPDRGQTWHRLTEDIAKRSPVSINLPGDGHYGIRIVVSNGNGFGGKAPVRGDAPHCTIEVDSTPPFVQLRPAELLANSGHVELRWNATDKNLGNEPVSLFFRTRPDGPWQVIARGLKNEGVYRWAFPRDAGGQFLFKVEITDLAGNVSTDVARQPMLIDTAEPRATVVGVTGTGR